MSSTADVKKNMLNPPKRLRTTSRFANTEAAEGVSKPVRGTATYRQVQQRLQLLPDRSAASCLANWVLKGHHDQSLPKETTSGSHPHGILRGVQALKLGFQHDFRRKITPVLFVVNHHRLFAK